MIGKKKGLTLSVQEDHPAFFELSIFNGAVQYKPVFTEHYMIISASSFQLSHILFRGF